MTEQGKIMTSDSLIWLEDLRREDVAKVGGKNSSLGEMISTLAAQGIKVPGGFATTSDAYRAFIEANDLQSVIREKMEALDEHRITLQEAGSSIRKAFEAGEFPEQIAADIREAYAQMSARADQEELSVAVRSSATAEDLPDASFAGQQETFLNVVGAKALMAACRRCYASLFTDRGDHLSQPQRLRSPRGGAVDRGAADGALRHVVLGRDVLHRHRDGLRQVRSDHRGLGPWRECRAGRGRSRRVPGVSSRSSTTRICRPSWRATSARRRSR